jgi:hypothetical protein
MAFLLAFFTYAGGLRHHINVRGAGSRIRTSRPSGSSSSICRLSPLMAHHYWPEQHLWRSAGLALESQQA